MARQDFEGIAESVRAVILDCERMERDAGSERSRLNATHRKGGAIATAHNLCAVLIATNEQFDRERFLRACGVEV